MIYASFQRQHRPYEAAMSTCGGSLVSRLPHTMPSRSYWRPALAFWCYVGCRDDALVLCLRPSPFLQKGLEQQLSPRIARWNETTRSAIRSRSAWRLQRRQSTKLCGRPFLCARRRSWHLGSALDLSQGRDCMICNSLRRPTGTYRNEKSSRRFAGVSS